jgi:hypothetical protein
VHNEPRPPVLSRARTVHWFALDAVVATGYSLVAVPAVISGARGDVSLRWGLAAVAVLCLTVALRHLHPSVALGAALALLVLLHWPYQAMFPWLYALYTVAATRRRRTSLTALGATLIAPAVVMPVVDRAVLLGLVAVLVWVAGYASRRRRLYEAERRAYQARQAAPGA